MLSVLHVEDYEDDFELLRIHLRRRQALRDQLLPILDEGGEVVRMIEHAVDVDDRRRMLEEFKESEERFRTLVELNADGVVIVDRDGVVRLANPAAQSMFGSGKYELIGRQFGSPISDEGGPRLDVVGRGRVLDVAEFRVADIRWNRKASHLILLRGTKKRRIS